MDEFPRLFSELCHFHLVSDEAQRLIDHREGDGLLGLARAILACPQADGCEFGGYCTILGQSLLEEQLWPDNSAVFA